MPFIPPMPPMGNFGNLRFLPPLPDVQSYRYHCLTCGQIYLRRRRIDLKKYRCGKCRGKLQLDITQDREGR